MNNILCEDILNKLNKLNRNHDNYISLKKKFIEDITKDFISCEKTFIDTYISFNNQHKLMHTTSLQNST